MPKVKDMNLAEQGKIRVEWASHEMPVLNTLREQYQDSKPLENIRIAGAIHVTKETANLIYTLRALGAKVSWCGCNPLSTQDDIAAALAKEGIEIFAWKGVTSEEYYWCIDQVLNTKPQITMDDGADLVFRLHSKFPELIKNIMFGTEETTTGVKRLKNMHEAGKLKYPVIAINDAETKWDFDNVYGTGQGTVDAIMRCTAVMLAGKTFVIAGYGHCGKGVAMRVKGMGGNVIITETDPINALRAVMEGFTVMPMEKALAFGDVVITATGCRDVVTKKHIPYLKNKSILLNVGHFNVEIDMEGLKNSAKNVKNIKEHLDLYEFENGKKVYILAEGRLANLICAEGHPSAVMDLSFGNQVLAILKHINKPLEIKVHKIDRQQDQYIASLKLKAVGIDTDALTEAQKNYITGFEEGT